MHLPNDKKLNPEAKNIVIGGERNMLEDLALDAGQALKALIHETRNIALKNEKQTKRIRELENQVFLLKGKNNAQEKNQ